MRKDLKSKIKTFDGEHLGGFLEKLFAETVTWRNYPPELKNRARFANQFSEKYVIRYQRSKLSHLAALCDQYGSDKGSNSDDGHPYPWPAHTYSRFYEQIFQHCREQISTVLECGIGTNNPLLASSMGAKGAPGASLRVWRDYFPHAHIFGVDIDRDVLFKEDRITTHYVDQTNASAVRTMWATIGNPEMDLIIDDGLHTFDAAKSFFEESSKHLRSTGIYVIEDVLPADLNNFVQYFDGLPFDVDYISLFRHGLALGDNILIVIRHSGTPLGTCQVE